MPDDPADRLADDPADAADAADAGEAPVPAGGAGPSWIARLCDLDRAGDTDTFIARNPGGTNQDGRLFGGLIAAQALAAAAATVDPEKQPQSLHLYFVRGGRPGVDVDMVVERTRDGRSFDTRRVTAIQEGKAILEMLASFHVIEPGVDRHPPAPPMPPVEECTAVGEIGGLSDRFEMRVPPQSAAFFGPPHWVRMRVPVEDDTVIRACALAFMSDMGLMAAARPPGTPLRFGPGFQAASLDHSIWFHRPFVPDAWHCYQASPINNVGARGLAVGGFYDEAGRLVASMAQEALWRLGDG